MNALKWLLIAGVGALALDGSPALASLDTVTARVPFPFMVEGKQFPAGSYQVGEITENVVEIQGPRGSTVGFYLVHRASGTDPMGGHPAFVFQKFETTYRLEHVWLSSRDGLTLPGTSQHTGHARAANDSAPTYLVAAATVGR